MTTRPLGGTRLRMVLVGAAGVTMSALLVASPPVQAFVGSPAVLHVGQIGKQDVRATAGSEPDTLVEPDVAASPVNHDVAIAVAHDGRYASGGAVAISSAWTRDGGAHWAHQPVSGLTKATGGSFDRASDPVVQFAADGTAYLSTLLFDVPGCRGGVAVSRSTDGGATWHPPVLVHLSNTCAYSDDKNWLVIDTSPTSPHRGRLYQFWTPFITSHGVTTSPQALRWSDDGGRTWSATALVTPVTANTQDSQPVVLADGSVVDTYQNFGPGRVTLAARRSDDGGATWGKETTIAGTVGGGPANVRCCLPAAAIDRSTGRIYAVWEGNGPNSEDPVWLSASSDGRVWSAPRQVSQGDGPGVQRVNVAVAAGQNHVYVSYGTLIRTADHGGFVQQQLSYSADGAIHFATPLSLGPMSALQWAAQAGGLFPGDYIGAALTTDRLYLVWCRSSRPPTAAALYHQTLWAAVLRP